MGPSEWVRERIEAMARQHRLIWVEDPYRLLEDADLSILETALAATGHGVASVENAFRLREVLNEFDAFSRAVRFVIIDRSYTLLDSHLLPKDAKPSDLRALPAPDWKPFLPDEAVFRPNVRDFLVSTTGIDDWPAQVNIYPYEMLARNRPGDLVRAYETFRRMGRSITDNDLVVIGASAVLGVNLFDITSPIVALQLAFHDEAHWTEISKIFNAREQEIIRRHLRMQPPPLGDLFGEHSEAARSAVVALLVLKQHPAFTEAPGKHLPFLSTALAPYRDCDVPSCTDVPTWFIEEEIPRFEQLCNDDFLAHIRDTLGLTDPSKAREFSQRERLSPKLRGLVPFESQGVTMARDIGDQDFRLDRLVPEFLQCKRDLDAILAATKGAIENLRLRPLKDQKARDLLQIFVDRRFYLVDFLIGRLQSLIYFVEGPARRQWPAVAGFEERWTKEVRSCREAITLAGRLRDDLDLAFGKLLEARYAEIVPGDILTTDLFYEKFIAPRRRTTSAVPRNAVVLVIDSMRFDIWRELVRPALEHDYEIEESVGFSLLPSETHVSRRAFFAGKPPATLPRSGRESDLFAELLSSIHGRPVVFDDLPWRPGGMVFGVRSRDGAVCAGVFDFPDALSHKVDWDPPTLQEAQRPLLTGLCALLAEAGPEALVFITADHGHVLQERGAPVKIYGSDNVGYRAAFVGERIEGQHAAHVFQIPARTLRHAASGWYVFPCPGHALLNASEEERSFRPTGAYRHGGLSLFEVVVPIACLKHRAAKAHVALVARPVEPPVVGRTTIIAVSLSADGMLSSPVSITADHAAIEGAVVSGVTTTPQTVHLRFLPTAPGRQSVRITAHLGGEIVGEVALDLEVSAPVAEPDVARAKLAKLFGDEG